MITKPFGPSPAVEFVVPLAVVSDPSVNPFAIGKPWGNSAAVSLVATASFTIQSAAVELDALAESEPLSHAAVALVLRVKIP